MFYYRNLFKQTFLNLSLGKVQKTTPKTAPKANPTMGSKGALTIVHVRLSKT